MSEYDYVYIASSFMAVGAILEFIVIMIGYVFRATFRMLGGR